MSLLSGQHDGGLVLPDELKEPMTLAEVLRSTTFVSANGRVYHLFGNEEDSFSVPSIPPVPVALVPPKKTALSLEDALRQIESFSSPVVKAPITAPTPTLPVQTVEHIAPTADSPTLQLFQALNESAAPRLVKREISPKIKEERPRPLRIISEPGEEPVEEPFIVPFAKLETPPEEPETKTVLLKVVAEPVLPVILPNIAWKRRQRHHREKTLYRKRISPPPPAPVPMLPIEEPPVIETPTFFWSAQLNSLMQTAENQIKMLADYLVVQANQGAKAICFKSVFPGDGCSTILLCAVRALLERNYSILLVDAHHQHIDLPKQLNVSGVGNDVMTLNEHLGLWVWQESKTPQENRATLARIVTEHREGYDLILVDNGSVTESPLTELLEFWGQIELDGIILVTNTKCPEEIPISHIAQRLRQHHIHLIGIAENYV